MHGYHFRRTKVKISAADIPGLLTKICNQGISLFDVKFTDELDAEASVMIKDIPRLINEIKRSGGICAIIKPALSKSALQVLSKRIILSLGLLLIILLTVLLPNRILFVKVIGNYAVPERLILTKAEECGITIGSFREKIRNEDIKNTLLSSIPQLQWVGVNTKGCVAEITVREKTGKIQEQKIDGIVSNIIANQDGIIIAKTILQGTGVCEVGQAVLEGQLLVSGYTDCGNVLKATNAEAEILAKTKRELCVVTPSVYKSRKTSVSHQRRFSILIGKKLIKLYKDSGICDGSCAKIYKRDYMQLPGGFSIPVCLVTEYISCYQTEPFCQKNFDWLEEFSDSYLKSKMSAGQIIDADKSLSSSEALTYLYGQYECTEMIGQRIFEEKIDTYGVSN